MLKWIQDEYGAEVVCLTVNLGQPGEDYAVIEGKALALGALECHVVDAREQFAREYVVPAIKANALYGGGYPLFTALGRPLIAKLAVEQARASGCDTIAHGCTGKGNDQVRIEATIATLAPELKVIAPVRSWQMGREEEIAYAREHGIPVKGGTEAAPYSIDDNLWGRSSEGRWIEDLSHAPEDDVFQLVTRPEQAPDEPETVTVEFERRQARRAQRRAPGARRAARSRRGDRRAPRRRHRRPHRGSHRRPEGARHLRGAGGGDPAARPSRARAPGLHDPPEPVQAAAGPPVGLPRLRRSVVGAAARRSRRLHAGRSTSASRGRSASSSTRATRAWSRAPRPTPSTTPPWRPSRSRAGCSRRAPRRASSSCGRCSRAWPGDCATSTGVNVGGLGAGWRRCVPRSWLSRLARLHRAARRRSRPVGRAPSRVACARERKRLQAAGLRGLARRQVVRSGASCPHAGAGPPAPSAWLPRPAQQRS